MMEWLHEWVLKMVNPGVTLTFENGSKTVKYLVESTAYFSQQETARALSSHLEAAVDTEFLREPKWVHSKEVIAFATGAATVLATFIVVMGVVSIAVACCGVVPNPAQAQPPADEKEPDDPNCRPRPRLR